MTLQEETQCIATPGFAGFVPSLKYQFGLTYGNATRHILRTDTSLKKGLIQTEISRKNRTAKNALTSESTKEGQSAHDEKVWKVGRVKYATGDDRFSFPPVPGYTGYIPRSQEYFGRPYVETTNASLASFQSMLKSKNQLPPRVQAIKDRKLASSAKQEADITQSTLKALIPKPPVESKTYVSGYTGYVPRLQNYFGVPYSESVRQAMDEFTTPRPPRTLYTSPSEIGSKGHRVRALKQVSTKPIPGFTGYIPGSRTCYSTTFGKTSEIAYNQFNKRDEKGRINQATSSQLPPKDLSKTLPIPGYRGHIPSYARTAERSYGFGTKQCLNNLENNL